MLLYTARAAKHYIRDPSDLLALAIEETNQTLKNSGLGNINLRLVHSQLIDYDASEDDHFTHLYTMVDGLGPFKDVMRLRKRADIVGLIIHNPTGCGLSTRIGPDSDQAFFIVHHACAAVSMSIAHEIEHILGARHDRFVDDNDSPHAFGHGYVNGRKWRDLMSYKQGCGGCARIPYGPIPRSCTMASRPGRLPPTTPDLFLSSPSACLSSDNATARNRRGAVLLGLHELASDCVSHESGGR